MKASALVTEKRVESANWRGMGIQSYGKNNDYPQRVQEIIAASVTGASCLDTYAKFIEGRGFSQQDFFCAKVNDRETADELLAKVAHDYAEFAGFALHVNYNANYKITSVSHIPFEWLRLEALKDNEPADRIALHKDWGKRNTALRSFRQSDIVWFDSYDPRPETIREQVERAGGWNEWKGQILYYSAYGHRCYPVPTFDSALTDMSTEEGLANVALRNARNNFLPAGIYIDHNNIANGEEQENETKEELRAFQGDTNAGKLLYLNLQQGEIPPEFVPFDAKNTDKDFVNTNKEIPDRIGRAFNQPPILRCQDVGANFGADLMRNAYDYYNAQTETERMLIERVFADVFSHFAENVNPEMDYRILPKMYRVNATIAERLGADTDKVLEVITGDRTEKQKRAILSLIYGIDADDVERLLDK